MCKARGLKTYVVARHVSGSEREVMRHLNVKRVSRTRQTVSVVVLAVFSIPTYPATCPPYSSSSPDKPSLALSYSVSLRAALQGAEAHGPFPCPDASGPCCSGSMVHRQQAEHPRCSSKQQGFSGDACLTAGCDHAPTPRSPNGSPQLHPPCTRQHSSSARLAERQGYMV